MKANKNTIIDSSQKNMKQIIKQIIKQIVKYVYVTDYD